jgi:hypothetical protein
MEIQKPGPERLRDGDSPGDANRTSLIRGTAGGPTLAGHDGQKTGDLVFRTSDELRLSSSVPIKND